MVTMNGMVLVFQHYQARDLENQKRNAAAMKTWVESGARLLPYKSEQSSALFGDHRGCPFVSDMIEAAMDGPEDIIVILNNDIILGEGLGDAIWESCGKHKCYWAYRVPHAGGNPDGGLDLFAMTKGWWRFCGRHYPDLLIGYSWWDNIMRRMMAWSGCPEGKRLYFHPPHLGIDGRRDSPGEIYNKRTARRWLQSQGEPE